LSKSCQKVVKKTGKKFVKIRPELEALVENSETVRRRRKGRRWRFVVPRPGATLSHQVKSLPTSFVDTSFTAALRKYQLVILDGVVVKTEDCCSGGPGLIDDWTFD
jgi:hypothetical protein